MKLKLVGWKHWSSVEDSPLVKQYSREDFQEAINAAVLEKGWCFDGEMHQAFGVPVFETESGERFALYCTMRCWGSYMSNAWSNKLGMQKYTYMDFYMKDFVPEELKDYYKSPMFNDLVEVPKEKPLDYIFDPDQENFK